MRIQGQRAEQPGNTRVPLGRLFDLVKLREARQGKDGVPEAWAVDSKDMPGLG